MKIVKTDYKTGRIIANPEIINKNFEKTWNFHRSVLYQYPCR